MDHSPAWFDEIHGVIPNDGRCDKNGRFVFGGLVEKDARRPESKYRRLSSSYIVNTDGSWQVLMGGIACANSICFGAEDSMFLTDSRCWKPQHIKRYAYSSDHRAPTKPHVFAQWDDEKSALSAGCDGSIIDSEGRLWNAEFGGGRVVRYDDAGRVDVVVTVPEPYVTWCCFGGQEFDVLYIHQSQSLMNRASIFCVRETPGRSWCHPLLSISQKVIP